jgi:hypothetical protein
MWTVAVNILSKKSRTAEKGWYPACVLAKYPDTKTQDIKTLRRDAEFANSVERPGFIWLNVGALMTKKVRIPKDSDP